MFDDATVPIEEINEYKVMDFITTKVANSHLYLMANKTTVHEMWKAILLSFERTVTLSAADLRKELFEMRLKNESLKNYGDPLSDESYKHQLLNSLLKEYLPVKIVMLDKNLEKMSWEPFNSLLLMFGQEVEHGKETKIVNEISNNQVTAMHAHQPNRPAKKFVNTHSKQFGIRNQSENCGNQFGV